MGAIRARVLIVDDVAALRELCMFILKRHADGEFEVVGEAGDGEEAIRRAAELQPDIILLDISMPVMDGLEALPGILKATPGSRVVIFSGFEASRLAATAYQLGAVAYLEKGAPPAKLVEVLRRAAETPVTRASYDDSSEAARSPTDRRWGARERRDPAQERLETSAFMSRPQEAGPSPSS